MSEANKEVVRKIEEAWNANNLGSLDAMFSPDFKQFSGFPGMPPTIESAKQAHSMSIEAMPDRKTEIQEMMAEDDSVMVRMRMTGTNTGGFPMLTSRETATRSTSSGSASTPLRTARLSTTGPSWTSLR